MKKTIQISIMVISLGLFTGSLQAQSEGEITIEFAKFSAELIRDKAKSLVSCAKSAKTVSCRTAQKAFAATMQKGVRDGHITQAEASEVEAEIEDQIRLNPKGHLDAFNFVLSEPEALHQFFEELKRMAQPSQYDLIA